MTQNKTQATDVKVSDFLEQVELVSKRKDGIILNQIFQEVTGFEPVLWGTSLVGYGRYHYKYASGREGDIMATGFSPRKAKHSIYIMPGYADFDHILKDLGKYKMGKSCLYVNKLADIDLEVLKILIRAGLKDLDAKWPVQPL